MGNGWCLIVLVLCEGEFCERRFTVFFICDTRTVRIHACRSGLEFPDELSDKTAVQGTVEYCTVPPVCRIDHPTNMILQNASMMLVPYVLEYRGCRSGYEILMNRYSTFVILQYQHWCIETFRTYILVAS